MRKYGGAEKYFIFENFKLRNLLNRNDRKIPIDQLDLMSKNP